MLRELGVTSQDDPDDGLHDGAGITLNMMLDDPASVRWADRVATGQAVINGVSIANLTQSLAWAEEVAAARSERTAGLIKDRISGR